MSQGLTLFSFALWKLSPCQERYGPPFTLFGACATTSCNTCTVLRKIDGTILSIKQWFSLRINCGVLGLELIFREYCNHLTLTTLTFYTIFISCSCKPYSYSVGNYLRNSIYEIASKKVKILFTEKVKGVVYSIPPQGTKAFIPL